MRALLAAAVALLTSTEAPFPLAPKGRDGGAREGVVSGPPSDSGVPRSPSPVSGSPEGLPSPVLPPQGGGRSLPPPAHIRSRPGDVWRALAPAAKLERLRGYAAGLRAAAAELALVEPVRARALEAQAVQVEKQLAPIRDLIDRFYMAPAQRGVPVSRAMRFAVAASLRETDAARWLASPGATPRLAAPAGRIPVSALESPYVKDPAFVDEGRPVGKHRYIAFGDLVGFYLKRVAIGRAKGREAPPLVFAPDHLPLTVAGLPKDLDAAWAPALRVVDGQVVLLFCAGRMVKALEWPSFRLRMATAPLARFVAEAEAGRAVTFDDQGALAPDARPFDDGDYGVIDPAWYLGPAGESWLTYTVVRHGVAGKRYHEEAVWGRPVEAQDPRRATGPDVPLWQGRANTPDDGVAEAQEVVRLGGTAWLFVSSRAGDKDQRLLVAPLPALAPLPDGALRPLMDPGGAAWKGAAVGSSGAALIGRHAYLVHQGMDKAGRFSLGWTALDVP